MPPAMYTPPNVPSLKEKTASLDVVIRERLAEQGVIIEGRNARETLATYLLDNEFLGPRDLVRLP